MNLLYISPNFPPNFRNFITRLAKSGVKVWGLGESDFYSMPEELRENLAWYTQTNLNDWDSVLGAINNMLEQHPQLREQRFCAVESHNEHWLRLESLINEKYNIDGIRPCDVNVWKKKSGMKQVFIQNNIKVATGVKINTYDEGLYVASQIGYPLILKPDEGVGASNTYKVVDEDHLRQVLPEISGDYFMEEFVNGKLVSYDGLTDIYSNVVFENSLIYSEGVLEYMQGKDPSFYITRDIPQELSYLGQKIAKIFGVRKKFFHFEFFEVNGEFLPLEINVRPPGGPIIDMMNYSADCDLFQAYADVILTGTASLPMHKKYYCGYVGRRDRNYQLGYHDIMAKYGHSMIQYEENPGLFQEAMGKYKCIFRTQSREGIYNIMIDLLR